jgi:hypothetical protein
MRRCMVIVKDKTVAPAACIAVCIFYGVNFPNAH